MRASFQGLLYLGALFVAMHTTAVSIVHAQSCFDDDDAGDEDDGGMCVDDDASIPSSDGGRDSGSDSGDSGTLDDAGDDRDVGVACSCESTRSDDNGRIHVCTGSESNAVCADFDCETGRVFSLPCPTEDVKLCCTIGSRRLYSQLYDDCTHPNCESGFRSQCAEFGGYVTTGACELEVHEEYESDADSGGFCSVARVGAAGGSARGLAALALFGSVLALRKRRGDRGARKRK